MELATLLPLSAESRQILSDEKASCCRWLAGGLKRREFKLAGSE